MNNYHIIGKSEKKIDSLSLATGTSKFVDDFKLKDPLYLALLYSPHAHAEIVAIDDTEARKLSGVVDVFHFKNVKPILHTTAGQGFPEPSPYDTVLFDTKMRFVGDRVAMVAAESRETAAEAIKLINVEYNVLEPLFDSEKAMSESAPKLHGPDRFTPIGAKYEPDKNLAAEVEIGFGDLKKGEEEADFIIDQTYKAHYGSHCAQEPHAAISFFDEMGRLVIVSTTQVPFHVRRIVSKVCEFPLAKIRVIKPRIGGGFGGKQEVFLEQLVALTTIKHKRPAKIVLSRKEVFQNSRTRHPVRVRLRTGVKNDGEITFLEMDSLLNSGAYGTHALTVLSNCGAKVLPLFNKIENMHFIGRSVYTNLPVGGAYRGYGATQGYFALNQQLDMITRKLDIDLLEYIKKYHIKVGETSQVFKALGEGTEGVTQYVNSCKLDECIDIGAKEIGWYDKRGKKITNGDKARGVGLSVAMQGSGIPLVDMAAAYMKMNDDGSFNLDIGATDIGTGSDTVLAQIAAEVLGVELDKMIVLSSDTDRTPFDVGAYASSTTYVSGGAVKKCAEKIREQILDVAVKMMAADKSDLELVDGKVNDSKNNKCISLSDVAVHALYTENQFQIQAGASQIVEQSPPPFIAQFVEVEVDKKTGEVNVIKFVSVADCGQALNPILAEGQIDGAVVNGICYALTEQYKFSANGNLLTKHFRDYKIWTAADLPEIKTIIVDSHEESGPFGAKSVGEIGINGPMPAIANAIYDAVGVRLFEAPFTPAKVYREMKKTGKN
ncbi:molybdopterin-dependent oxidoreductase [bacterium]|nr:molybdopterin-dependent oxidoreductase [bacterium]MBU1064837.1 molybdopterin-dependent oxidoreductase [bacterium]MBU1635474.1 molybdopterin-dependent oxidoreductase [bacterium]MBU1874107.1 molybdopterin-dependent oxidoreductase [bacterium]